MNVRSLPPRAQRRPPTEPRQPRPPKHLKPATRRWWASVVAGYNDFEEHHLRLLTLAGEAWDRNAEAREVLARDGLTYADRFNAPHARPEVAVERDSKIAFARLLREIALDVEPPGGSSRPPGIRR